MEEFRDNKLFCKACEAVQAKNIFVSGCSTVKLDYVNRHEKMEEHKAAIAAPKRADEFKVAQCNVIQMEVRNCSLLAFQICFMHATG
jgi:hypothetical protein